MNPKLKFFLIISLFTPVPWIYGQTSSEIETATSDSYSSENTLELESSSLQDLKEVESVYSQPLAEVETIIRKLDRIMDPPIDGINRPIHCSGILLLDHVHQTIDIGPLNRNIDHISQCPVDPAFGDI
jgi:hypothetical protein